MRTWMAGSVGMVALLAACASSGRSPSETQAIRGMLAVAGSRESDPRAFAEMVLKKDTVPLPPERAWPELLRAYATLRIPVTRIDEPNRQLGGSAVPLRLVGGERPAAWLDCGHGLSEVYANEYEVTFSMATRVMPLAEGRSTIESIIRSTARPRDVSTSAFPCTSRGTLETRVAQMVREGAAASGR